MRRLLHVAGRWAACARWSTVASIVGLVVLLAILVAVIVFVPQLAIDPHGLTRDQWLTHVQDLRITMLQGLGGLTVLFGAFVAALNLGETSRQNRAVLELQRRGQTTERFTRAIEQLGQQGPEKLDIRIGAAYALEQIALDSVELHWPIIEVLTAYLREHAPRPSTPQADPVTPRRSADHEAVATVIGRRRRGPNDRRLDLHETDLTGVQWLDADLGGADFHGAALERACLSGANLRVAHLEGADLQRATFHRTQMQLAAMERANLAGAFLWEANLRKAKLGGANLAGATLWAADLQEADLRGANLKEASLTGANLEGANLAGATLEQADLSESLGLSWEQLQLAVDAPLAQLPADLAERLVRASAISSSAPSERLPKAAGGPDPDHR